MNTLFFNNENLLLSIGVVFAITVKKYNIKHA